MRAFEPTDPLDSTSLERMYGSISLQLDRSDSEVFGRQPITLDHSLAGGWHTPEHRSAAALGWRTPNSRPTRWELRPQLGHLRVRVGGCPEAPPDVSCCLMLSIEGQCRHRTLPLPHVESALLLTQHWQTFCLPLSPALLTSELTLELIAWVPGQHGCETSLGRLQLLTEDVCNHDGGRLELPRVGESAPMGVGVELMWLPPAGHIGHSAASAGQLLPRGWHPDEQRTPEQYGGPLPTSPYGAPFPSVGGLSPSGRVAGRTSEGLLGVSEWRTGDGRLASPPPRDSGWRTQSMSVYDGPGAERLREAVETVIGGFGSEEERRRRRPPVALAADLAAARQ